jgi:hypothetical protein
MNILLRVYYLSPCCIQLYCHAVSIALTLDSNYDKEWCEPNTNNAENNLAPAEEGGEQSMDMSEQQLMLLSMHN